MSEVTAKMHGLEELLRELREFPQKVQTRVLTGAVGSGAKVVKDEVVRLAPVYVEFNIETGRYIPVGKNHPPPGTLKKAIYATRAVNKCTPTKEVFRVGVRTVKKTANGKPNPNDAFYAKWVEYGHYTRTPKSIPGTRKQRRDIARAKGLVRWIPPQPFFRPGVDNTREAAIDAVRQYIENKVPVLTAGLRYLKAA